MAFAQWDQSVRDRIRLRALTLHQNIVLAAALSITDGSPLTGAPGQPVDTGDLKASFAVNVESETPDGIVATISSDLPYARSIEDGLSYSHGDTPMTLRSNQGGWHSVKLTAAGIDRIAADERAKLG